MSLRNINPDPLPDNIGGLGVVFFTPWENIVHVPAADGLLIRGNIQMKAGSTWYMMGYTRHTSSYEQPQKDTRHGNVYDIRQKGLIARDTPELAGLLQQMSNQRMALLFRDRNGYLRITPPQVYTRFGYKLSTGEGPSDRNGYSVDFTVSSPAPAYYYSGTFEIAELGEVTPPPSGSGDTVIIRFNGQTVKIMQPGETLDITSDFTMDFDIKMV